MLMRVTRPMRLIAGKLLSAIYLLCVLAPTLSFAFADGARAAPCLTENEHGMGIVHVHEHPARGVQHVHDDGRAHDRSVIATGSEHHDGSASAGSEPASSAGDHHKAAGGQCCGMACVSALPATITEIVQPAVPPSRCVSKNYLDVADNTPHQLYRPPNT